MVLSETQVTHAHSHGPVDDKGENSLNHYINLTHTQRIDYYTEQEQAMVLSETQVTHAHSHGPVDDKGENSLNHYINLTHTVKISQRIDYYTE